MRRETQNVLLLLLGGAVLKISLNGQYLRYVKPSLQPWLLACGAVAIVLAVVGILRDLNHRTQHRRPEAEHGHHHSSRGPWLLMLPVLAIFLIAPPALGSDKVARSGDRTIAQASGGQPDVDFVELPEGEAPSLKIGDVVTRVVYDEAESLQGRQIRIVGFVARGDDGATYLARLVMGCCAADAIPVKVRLEGGSAATEAAQYAPDTWLEARGEALLGTATEANGYTPTFRVTQLTPVEAPPDPYEF